MNNLAQKIPDNTQAQASNFEHESMSNNSPINIIYCDQDLNITYVNPKSLETLSQIQQYLPIPVNQIMGTNIDVFHKDPAHQRRILANPKNFPYRTIIEVGPEKLDLHVSAIFSDSGEHIGSMATWDIVTKKLETEDKQRKMEALVENAPLNIMYATLDGTIEYMNPKSLETLQSIERHLPVKANEIQGGSYDIFHKNPSYQRGLLSNDRNLPHSAKINVGPEILDLNVSAMYDGDGVYTGPMVTWEVITQKVALETKSARMNSMVENAPVNILIADLDFNLTYMNPASKSQLNKLAAYLPKPVNELEGQSIDIFHKNPTHQRTMLSNPNNLPYRAKIQLGPETLDLQVAAVYDHEQNYIGPMVTWEVITEKLRLVENLKEAAAQVSSAAEEVSATSSEMENNSQSANEQATQAATASEEIAAGVRQVAHSSEELKSSIGEISQNMNETSRLVSDTLKEATEADKKMNQLSTSSKEIGDVIKVINSIAQQTNLLALNATIEAARAGDAGRGFSVVANEVKELANQTANATEQITKMILTIQSDTASSVDALKVISTSISKVNEFASQISAAVAEQNATTDELTRISNEASQGVGTIAQNIQVVSQTSNQTATNAQQLVEAAQGMTGLASKLNQLVQDVDK